MEKRKLKLNQLKHPNASRNNLVEQPSNIQYPICVVKQQSISPNLLRASNNTTTFLKNKSRIYECSGGSSPSFSERKKVFEDSGIDLNKHLTVSISKKLREMANEVQLRENRKSGIITPWEISNGVSIPYEVDMEENSAIRRGRRHSSDSDSGVDVSVEGLVVGVRPPLSDKEPLKCNLCHEHESYESGEHLWKHQKSKHMGKDCTEENVFPEQTKTIFDFSACKANVGPDMLKFEEADKQRFKKKQNYSSQVWVCFECSPPTILVEDRFNSHAEDFFHFDNVLPFRDKTEADAEVQRRSTAS